MSKDVSGGESMQEKQHAGDGPSGGTGPLRVAALATALLAVLVGWYKSGGNDVWAQSSFCFIAPALQQWDATPHLMPFVLRFHKVMGSHAWMVIAAIVSFVSFRRGSDLYTYLIIGHTLKNWSKSAIASPRGFWFCPEGYSDYCGRGYSLPSGHCMMSISFSLWVYSVYPKRWVLLLLVFLELFIVYEVVILGTHTPADVVIGFAYGVWWFVTYSSIAKWWRESNAGKPMSPRATFALLSVMSLMMLGMEMLEDVWDAQANHPDEWARQYAMNCKSVTEENARRYMRNSSAFTKVALYVGLLIGHVGQRALDVGSRSRAGENAAMHSVRVALRVAIGFVVLSYGCKHISRLLFNELALASWSPVSYKMLVSVLEEAWVLCAAPCLFHLMDLGHFLPETT